MAYTGLTIETAKETADGKYSHCIPAYPEYTSSTTFDAAFYTERRASNDELAGGTITYVQPESIAFTSSGTITGTLQVGETITLTGASYTGGVGTVSENYILQSSTDGNAPWSFVASSSTQPWTHTLGAGLEGLFIRESTQLTDDEGLSTRNQTAQGPVIAA